ncbi:sodium:solute symporter family protein [Pirellulales bacterium]|nr:sodium:solute symporter family protein [Pirellulales bacterium]
MAQYNSCVLAANHVFSGRMFLIGETSSLGKMPALVVTAYLAVLIAISVYSYLKSRQSEDDYYLAGRGQNLLVTALTIMATFFSSAALLGIPGVIYKDGIAFFFFALNLPLSGAAVYVLGSRIARLGRARGYVTPGDMLADYYGGSSAVRLLVALAGILYVLPYVIVQIRAGGHLAQQMFPPTEPLELAGMTLDVFDVGASVLAVVMTLYVLVGGMRSVALTDVVQGILLLLGMLVSGAAIIFALGGVRAYFAAVAELPSEALSMPGVSGAYGPWKMLSLCVFASLATMIQPAQWMRYYAASSTLVLKRSAMLFATLLPLCFLFGVMLVGLGARALYPPTVEQGQIIPHETVGSHDQALIAVLRIHGAEMLGFAGPLLVSMILVAILAASMSTADSNLHALSAVITRDLYDQVRPQSSDAERAWIGRAVIVIASGLALWLVHIGERDPEFAPLKMIIEMLYVAMAFSCQVLPLAIDAMFLHKGTRAGAICGISAGLVTILCFTPLPGVVLGEHLPGVYDSSTRQLKQLFDIGAIGFSVNVAFFVVVSLITRKLDPGRIQEFRSLMQADS